MPTRSLLTMHRDLLVLLSALGVLYSLAVVLKEFDRPIGYAVTVPGIQLKFIFFSFISIDNCTV